MQPLKKNCIIIQIIYKTEDVEPLKVIAVCEYKNNEAFQNTKKYFKNFNQKYEPLS